jgi:hypothetical protein
MPIWAFIEQTHEQHIQIHMAQIEHYKTLPDEQMAQSLVANMMDHIAKHEGYRVYQHINMTMAGGMMPPIDLYDDDPSEEMPPEVEQAVTAQSAALVGQIMQEIQANKPPPPEDAKTNAEIQRKQMEQQQKLKDAEETHQQELRHAEEKFQAEQARKLADTDPNSAQENIMRAIAEQRQALNVLATTVSSVVAMLSSLGREESQEGEQPV